MDFNHRSSSLHVGVDFSQSWIDAVSGKDKDIVIEDYINFASFGKDEGERSGRTAIVVVASM